MPSIPIRHEHRDANGLAMYLGHNPRVHDPKEDKYVFASLDASAATADLNREIGLDNFNGVDLRRRIKSQGRKGSCAACSTCEGAEMAYAGAGGTPVDLHEGWLYEKVRIKEGTFPQDAGSNGADNLDIAMTGIPKMSDATDTDDVSFQYAQNVDADAPNQIYVASHHPIWNDPNVLNNIWLSLAAGMPVLIGMAWTNAFFSPQGGLLPSGQTPAQGIGGHEITGYKWVPGVGLVCINHWTEMWNVNGGGFGHGIRSGEFVIPIEYLTNPQMVWDLQAVTAVAQSPKPRPQPVTTCHDVAVSVADKAVQPFRDAVAKNPASAYAKRILAVAQGVRDAVDKGITQG